jgi:hypothetical protein
MFLIVQPEQKYQHIPFFNTFLAVLQVAILLCVTTDHLGISVGFPTLMAGDL